MKLIFSFLLFPSIYFYLTKSILNNGLNNGEKSLEEKKKYSFINTLSTTVYGDASTQLFTSLFYYLFFT